MTTNPSIDRADEPRKSKDYAGAVALYLDAIKSIETPDADVCLKLARCYLKLGDHAAALRWTCRVVDAAPPAGESFLHWQAAAALVEQILKDHAPAVKRSAKAFVLGSYTTTQFIPMLRLAAMREGILLEVHEGDYAQYRQEIINPRSRLYETAPDFVILAVHTGEFALPEFSNDPDKDINAELARWTSLWDTLTSRSGARMLMHNFVAPIENAFGHLSARLEGSRASMIPQLNARLGHAAGNRASIVDCDRIASHFGKRRWCDDRYWHISKQAVALDALPTLARHTTAVLAADLGLSRKCLVLDLDNTLWGGVIGEDGVEGIKLGQGSPEGEAYLALQSYIRQLKSKGVILAVCSKNNDADAREPFEKHSEMLLRLDDFAVFIANWEGKADNIRAIARTLNIGLDSLVFLDDNPVEREVIRQLLPEVEVLALPRDPAGYARALSDYLMFETASFTKEDAARTEQYRATARIAELESTAGSIEDFYRSLEMKAVVAPFDELHLPRIVQLIGKTNQFNLTTRRHTMQDVRRFKGDAHCLHLYLKLRDRFTDHGLVSVLIAQQRGKTMEIDTWLMSCRVIGRTVEAELLSHLSRAALERGCTELRGIYIPTAKNMMVKDIFATYGFERESAGANGTTTWRYDLAARGAIENEFIENVPDDASHMEVAAVDDAA